MFKIGEFAKLVDTTAKTLRFYDDEDILKPDYVDHAANVNEFLSHSLTNF